MQKLATRNKPPRANRASAAVSAALASAGPSAPGTSLNSHKSASFSEPNLSDWMPGAYSADADLLPDLGMLTARSRDLGRNNGLMASAQQTLRDNIIGAVLRLSASPDYRLLGWSREQAREWSNTTESKFRSWGDTTECDAADTQNLLAMSLQALGGAMLNGDALALPLWLPRPGASWYTRLMLIESDRLSTPLHLMNRPDIRGGIEFDAYGAPVAYYILKQHPGDIFNYAAMANTEYERIPARTEFGRRRVIHLHDKERTGQSRGKPVVSAVMREIRMAGDYAHNELQASVTNSLVAAFLESDLDTESASALFGEDPRQSWTRSMADAKTSGLTVRKLNSGSVIPLPAGARINTVAPGRPNPSFEAFMLATLRHIAAGMNMPYELLLKDFSKTSYSSARASMLEAWRYFNGRRRWLTDTWLRPVYELWLEEAIGNGHIQAPDYYQNRYAYQRARFIFGGRGWVDPVKEATAAQIRIVTGLSTLEKECAEQGDDYEEILDQQAIEAAMRTERGLPQPGQQPGPATQSADPALDPEDNPDFVPGDAAPQDAPTDPPPAPAKKGTAPVAKRKAKGTAK
jgi:lambda family phage portal protein